MNFTEHPIDWTDEKVSRLWNYYSHTSPYSEAYFSKVFGGRLLKASGLPLTQPLEVLDFGSGPGFIWEHLLRLKSAWFYTAVDFSPQSIAELVSKTKGHSRFRGAQPITSLPCAIPDAAFDVILLLEVVEHLSDAYLDGTLKEIARLLKPGGVVLISTPNQENLADFTRFCPDCGAIFHQWQHVRSWDTASLTATLQHYGFRLRRAKATDFGAYGIAHRILWLLRGLGRRGLSRPNLVAVFQKA